MDIKSYGLKAFFLILLGLLNLNSSGQTLKFQSGTSIRDNQQSHYYKMVSWDDSDYQEFSYWQENESGSVLEFMNWRAIFPPNYDASGNTKYPMIVMLHGAGESGRKWTDNFNYSPSDPEYDNNGNNIYWGGKPHRDAVNNSTFPGIVMFPQSSYNASWDADDRRMLAGIIEHMISSYHVNPYKISAHGLSNGAKATWEFASYRPDLIASILPMSGVGSDIETVTDQLVTTPVWLFQGGMDSNPSPGASENWIDKLQEKGGKPKYTLYEENGHNTWIDAYAEPDFFSWMMDRDKRNIYVFGDTSNLYLTENGTIDLGFSAGFTQYQWNLDGEPVQGANSRYFTADQPGTYTVDFLQPFNGEWAVSYPLTIEAYSGDPIVHIPDQNFKTELLNNSSINTNGDGQIQVSEAEAYSGQIKVNSSNISDLTGIEAFSAITDLRIHYNQLTTLDLSDNTQLIELHCQGNQLEALDISINNKLAKLRCFDNQLTTLNIQNGNNQNFGLFQASGNNLTCIQVDDIEYAQNNWSDDVDPGVEFNTTCATGIVYIPDANFKSAVVADTAINTNEDNEIQYDEAENYSGSINVSSKQIEDLTGIEAFINIQSIDFSDNSISSADFSSNTRIESIIGSNNQLSSLVLGSNQVLSFIRLDINSLAGIDLSNLPGLSELQLANNQLTSLDVSNNSQLTQIFCQNNLLEELNLQNTNNQNISEFEATNNSLTCIQVDDKNYANSNWSDNVDAGVEFSESCGEAIVNIPDQNFKNALLAITSLNTNNDEEIQYSEAETYTGQINVNSSNITDITGIEAFTSITDLRVHNNSITNIDLSANTELLQLHCQKNALNSLDISANTKIEKFRCFNNQLTSLNVQNGNNQNFDLFQAYDNDLTCIQVDDVSYAETQWSDDIDTGVEFSTNCSGARMVTTENQSTNMSVESEEINVYPNPTTDFLTIRYSNQENGNTEPSLKIYNLQTGQIQKPLKVSSNAREIVVDMTNLASGLYLIQVKDQNYRIIKQQ